MVTVTNCQDKEFVEAEAMILERCRMAERIHFDLSGNPSTWHVINKAFSSLPDKPKVRAVARHLIGATLQLRFPESEIPIKSSRLSDTQANVTEDFQIGDTAIYVTDFATFDAFDKYQHDLLSENRVFLLVPENRLASGRLNAGQMCNNQIAVESIETFVSQSLEIHSTFQRKQLFSGLKNLINLYNERVDAVETDKSLMIELPSNLLKS